MAALAEALSGQLAPPRAISWITASLGDVVKMIAIDDRSLLPVRG